MSAGTEPPGSGVLDWMPRGDGTSRMERFAELASQRTGRDLTASYHDLWKWSVEDLEGFWALVWDVAGLPRRPDGGPVLASARMPGAVWFPDARLNFTGRLLDGRDADGVALVVVGETGDRQDVTWGELRGEVAAFATYLRSVGVEAGNVVVGYLPNGREAVVALLATAALGAVWAVCGLDYSATAALSRFEQLDPVVLVTATRQTYAGRERDRRGEVRAVVEGLPTLRTVVYVGVDDAHEGVPWAVATADRQAPLPIEDVRFDHPLWVLFSSGTTGKPKGIVHGHGGVVLEYVKQALHWDLGVQERLFWYTTPSWMMWNFSVASLLSGASVVFYDGSPGYPAPASFWTIAAGVEATVVGTSPAYLESCRKAGLDRIGHPALRAVGVTGSAFVSAQHHWLRSVLGPEPQIVSSSGGTDVVSAFAAGAPTLPVWEGELSAPCLGVDLAAFDADGEPVVGEVGELVVRGPMPSMPVRFWGDDDGARYHDAYFDTFDGVWRHGDWITVTGRGSVVIHGRSDATLNRNGIRIGSADIYGPVEGLPEIVEALVVGLERPDGTYWMPMFVVVAADTADDEQLRQRILEAIRSQASSRHLPDEIVVVPGILHTRTGKKLEVPVKQLLMGRPLERVVDAASVDHPELLAWYADFAASRQGP